MTFCTQEINRRVSNGMHSASEYLAVKDILAYWLSFRTNEPNKKRFVSCYCPPKCPWKLNFGANCIGNLGSRQKSQVWHRSVALVFSDRSCRRGWGCEISSVWEGLSSFQCKELHPQKNKINNTNNSKKKISANNYRSGFKKCFHLDGLHSVQSQRFYFVGVIFRCFLIVSTL